MAGMWVSSGLGSRTQRGRRVRAGEEKAAGRQGGGPGGEGTGQMGTPTSGCRSLAGILFTPRIWEDRAKLKGRCWGTGDTPWSQWVTQGVLPAEVRVNGGQVALTS